jgi:NIMA (never in mitosis gene a)-related kinase
VKRTSDGLEYALKKVKMSLLSSKEKENALNEVRILASIQSPYIVSYKDAFYEEATNCLCIIMELCENGDILNKIKSY